MKNNTRFILTVACSASFAWGAVQIQRFPPPSEMGMNFGYVAIWIGVSGIIIIVGQILLPAFINWLVSRSKRLASK